MKWINDGELPDWLLLVVAPALALAVVAFTFWSLLAYLGGSLDE